MGQRLGLSVFVVGILIAPWAHGVIGTMDTVPSATLLLPYFEADTEFGATEYDRPGPRTAFTMTNVTASSVIAHVMLFTDYGIPSVYFDVVLPAYGSERIDLSQVFGENALELGVDSPTGNASRLVTEDAVFQDGFETGDLGSWTSSEARASYDTLRAYHTGNMSPRTMRFAGEAYWDETARGYVLVDVMNEQGARFPDDTGYFVTGGAGKAANTNALTGDYLIENEPNNFAHGDALIHVEADGSDALVTTSGNYTFYARYVAATAVDNREPLATSWAARYLNGGAFDAGTHILYWRDPKVVSGLLNYMQRPDWYPLRQASLKAYDESGNSTTVLGVWAFPLACGRVEANSSTLPGLYDFGWLYANLNNVNTGLLSTTSQCVLALAHQSWGRYAAGQCGLPTDNASDYNP